MFSLLYRTAFTVLGDVIVTGHNLSLCLKALYVFVHIALSLFLMSVNIKTPVVVENITLMCLRILQKLIKPPAPTSKKNKVNIL